MKRTTTWIIAAVALLGSATARGQEATGPGEADLIAVLKSDADVQKKSEACRELAHIGTARAVPALAALLADEKLSHMARYALETIPGDAVNDALRNALGSLKAVPRLGVIESLGKRRDAKAADALAGLLDDPDPATAQASARALGLIGGQQPAQALGRALPAAQGATQLAICEGLFSCAQELLLKGQNEQAAALYDSVRGLKQSPPQVRSSALRGAILARGPQGLPLLIESLRSQDWALVQGAAQAAMTIEGAEAIQAIAQELAKSNADRQVMLAGVLGGRRDPAALPALLSLVRSGETTVRVAAVNAVAQIGHSSVVPTLISLVNDPVADVARAAGAALTGLPGEDVDAAMLKGIVSQDRAQKLTLMNLAAQRRLGKAMPLLQQIMDDPDEQLRTTAIRCYGEMATMAQLSILLDRLAKTTGAAEIGAMEKAIGSICALAEDRNACVKQLADALGRSVPQAKPALLRKLRVPGGPDALKVVRLAVDDSDLQVRREALRVIGDWKANEAIPVLRDLTRTLSDPVDKILAIRGYLGLATVKEIPAAERMAICRDAAPLIQRPEEKRLLLGAVSSLGNAQLLDLITPCLDDPAVKQEGITAVMLLAEKRPKKQHVALTKAALEKVISIAASTPVAARAGELLKQMSKE